MARRRRFENNYISLAPETPVWEKTEDGFLRTTARVLKEGIMPYHRDELQGLPEDFEGDMVLMFVSLDTLSAGETIRSLEGAQLTAPDHEWITLDNAANISKGNTAGKPRVDGPYLVVDLLVTDPSTIARIESRELGEISGAYHANSIFEKGDFDGQPFDARQCNIRFNHIAIIPPGTGRGGEDVKITNKVKGELQMADEIKVVRVQLNNGRFINTDEDGAKEIAADKADGEAKEGESTKNFDKLTAALEEKQSECEVLQGEIEELKGELSVYKEKLDTLLSEENIEAAAEAMNEETGEAEEIIENVAESEEDDKKKEEIKNSIKKLHGSKLHRQVLSLCGVKVENMSDPELRGAFKAHVQIFRNKKLSTKVVSGTKIFNKQGTIETQPTQRTALERLGIKK